MDVTQTWRGKPGISLRRTKGGTKNVFCRVSLLRPNLLVGQFMQYETILLPSCSNPRDSMHKGPRPPEGKACAHRTLSWLPSSGRSLLLVKVIGPRILYYYSTFIFHSVGRNPQHTRLMICFIVFAPNKMPQPMFTRQTRQSSLKWPPQ